jgi:hypothetical protein
MAKDATMQNCTLVLRQFSAESGITETNLPMMTLEELFDYCVTKTQPHLIEQLMLVGQDDQGRARLLTFTFQSVADYVQ